MIGQLTTRVRLVGLAAMLLAGPALAGVLKPVPPGKTTPVPPRMRSIPTKPAPEGSGLTWAKAQVSKIDNLYVATDAATADAPRPTLLKVAIGKPDFAKAMSVPLTLKGKKLRTSRGKKTATSLWQGSARIAVPQTIDGESITTTLFVNYSERGTQKPSLWLGTLTTLQGKVLVKGEACTIHVYDSNGDLKLSGTDRVVLIKGTAKIPLSPRGLSQIGNSFYKTLYTAKTNDVSIEAYKGKTGIVKSPLPAFQYRLQSKAVGTLVLSGKADTPLTVPAGEYQVQVYGLILNDKGMGYSGATSKKIKVPAGATTTLPTPSTFTALFQISLAKGSVRFKIKMSDSLGGRSLRLTKNGKKCPPAFEVVDSGNKVIYSNKFEYG
ncbi:MAG: hypothetical protein HN909_06620 [Phycisphaerales bacterium]|jgi:hypothetical protein|nr:hypothetical protein [Phycisphaerales bacterium]MBT7171427.1 hypothetical protein [Phycisphaerales bacterium]